MGGSLAGSVANLEANTVASLVASLVASFVASLVANLVVILVVNLVGHWGAVWQPGEAAAVGEHLDQMRACAVLLGTRKIKRCILNLI